MVVSDKVGWSRASKYKLTVISCCKYSQMVQTPTLMELLANIVKQIYGNFLHYFLFWTVHLSILPCFFAN